MANGEDPHKAAYENGKRDADAAWMKLAIKWIIGMISAGFVGAFTILSDIWSK